jgi:hypothetical protein
MMHSCCCIGFIEWCGFGFICFGFKNLFKWFGKQIHIKKGEGERAYLCCWWLGGPPGPACFFFLAGGPNQSVLFLPRRVGRARKPQPRAPPFLVSLMTGPHAAASSSAASRSTRIRPSQISCPSPISPGFGCVCHALTLYKTARACLLPFYPNCKSQLRPSRVAAKSNAAVARFRRLPFQSTR